MSILCTSMTNTKHGLPPPELVDNRGMETLQADKSRYSRILPMLLLPLTSPTISSPQTNVSSASASSYNSVQNET